MGDGTARQGGWATEATEGGVPVVLDVDAAAPVHREELRGEFPARLAALCSLLGKSDQQMADAMDIEPKQFWQYRTGRRIPAGAEMLNLMRLASQAEDGMAVLMGLRPELVEERSERWPTLKHQRRPTIKVPYPDSDPGARFLRRLRGSR